MDRDVERTRAPLLTRDRQARLAGVLYLVVIAGGLFAEAAVRASIIVPGDPAATLRAIADRESLWRQGLAVHALYLVAAAAVNVLVYGLFREVDQAMARLACALGLASVSIEAAALLQLATPLVVGPAAAAADPLGAAAVLASTSVRLFGLGFGLALLFFAGTCLLLGSLIVRSALVPRLIGWLLIVAGAAYVLNTLALLLAPDVHAVLVPWVYVPILPAELALAGWLLVRGVEATPRAAG